MQAIAEAHHGSARASSPLGQGSVFEVLLPAIAAPPETPAAPEPVTAQTSRPETPAAPEPVTAQTSRPDADPAT